MHIQVVCIAIVTLATLAGVVQPAAAAGPYTLTVMTATLPTARACAMAGWDGVHAYVFGGSNNAQQVVRYDPVADAVAVMGGTVPNGWYCSDPVWMPGRFYVFGGYSPASSATRIVRYNPGTDTATVLGAVLPFNAAYPTAQVVGNVAYVAGVNQIAMFDGNTESATLLPVTLPNPTSDPTSVWDGTYMDIFSSCFALCPSANFYVQRFDPVANTVTSVTLTAPPGTSLVDAAAIYDGTDAYIFGGDPLNDKILKWTPGTTTLTAVGNLPAPRDEIGHVFTGCDAYLFGGGDTSQSAQILRWAPASCQVTPIAKKAAFGASLTEKGCDSETFTFKDASTPVGSFVSWSWDFGDSSSGTGQTVSHTYTVPGSKTVTLTVVDTDGLPHTTSDSVFVAFNPCPPTIQPFAPITVLQGDAIHVCATGSAGKGGLLSFTIDHVPGSATFVDACFDWTPQPQDVGTYACQRVTVHEAGSTDTASTCLYVRVRAPPTEPEKDTDLDGIADSSDNCPSWPNHEQGDADLDGVGDACDDACDAPATACGAAADDHGAPGSAAHPRDTDLDGVADVSDNCPEMPNRDQADGDRDHLGDACDTDLDGDGVADTAESGAFLDNCPSRANADQADANRDGVGDACQVPGATAAGSGAGAAGPVERVRSILDGAGPWLLAALGLALVLAAVVGAAGLRRR
ncbi:MAG: thrombospondin type 3 repeat-containing protein [bacterium]